MPKAPTPRRLSPTQKASRIVQPKVASKNARRSTVAKATSRVTTTVAKTSVSSQR